MDKFVYNKIQKFQENIQKSVIDFEKAGGNKGFPVGTIRKWNGKRYKKKINNEWQYIGDSDNNKNKEGTANKEKKDDDLDELEFDAINAYTTDMYREVNDYLRGKLKGNVEDVKTHISYLRSALNNLPSYDNKTAHRVISEEGDYEDILEKYKNVSEDNAILEYDAFLSATDNEDIVSGFITYDEKKTPVIFEINTKENSNGSSISEYSAYPDEKEVLFQDKTQFNIKKVEKIPNVGQNRVKVVLEEI